MATVTDVEVANQSFPNVRQDLNDILEALATNFSADAEPTTTYPNQFWYETDTNLLYIRNEANDAWVTLASINQTSGEWEPRTAVIQAVDSAGLALKTDEGTTRVSIADDGSVTVNTSLDVDNIKIDGNSITSTDTNGDINITPDGTGKVVLDGLNYPTADGTDGQVLTTDGSGNIAFEDAGGAGIVLQIVQTVVTDTKQTTSNAFSAISGLSAAITPSSASSKIYVMVSLSAGSNSGTNAGGAFRLYRNGSNTGTLDGTSAGNRITAFAQSTSGTNSPWMVINSAVNLLDSPSSTSEQTYQVYWRAENTNSGSYLNRAHSDDDTTDRVRTSSSITLMEIAG